MAADEALRIGLATGSFQKARLAAAHMSSPEIAAKSPISLRAAKRALRQGLDVDLVSGLEIENQAWEEAAFSADRVEGIEAFNLRRAPRWPSWRDGGHDRTSPPVPAAGRAAGRRAESALPLPAQLTRFIITGGSRRSSTSDCW